MTSKEATSRFAQVVSKCVGCFGSYLGSERLSRIQISWQSLRSGHIFGIQKKGLVLNEQSDSFRNGLKN